MYGTVARMTGKPGSQEALRDYSQTRAEEMPGFIASYVYQMDADPDQYYLAVLFESKEAYVVNAQSPAQNESYEKLRALLSADPEWHDGEVIHATDS